MAINRDYCKRYWFYGHPIASLHQILFGCIRDESTSSLRLLTDKIKKTNPDIIMFNVADAFINAIVAPFKKKAQCFVAAIFGSCD